MAFSGRTGVVGRLFLANAVEATSLSPLTLNPKLAKRRGGMPVVA